MSERGLRHAKRPDIDEAIRDSGLVIARREATATVLYYALGDDYEYNNDEIRRILGEPNLSDADIATLASSGREKLIKAGIIDL